MVKIVKFEETYIDAVGKECSVFYVEYSDSRLISTGDFILDSVSREMTCEYLENYFNVTVLEMYSAYEEHMIIMHINKLIYRMSNFNAYYECNDPYTRRYLTKLSRDIKLNNILV